MDLRKEIRIFVSMNTIDILEELRKREYHDHVWNLGLTITKYSDGIYAWYSEHRTDKVVLQPAHHLSCFYPMILSSTSLTDQEFESIHHATRLTCLAMDMIIRIAYDEIIQKK